MGPFQYFLTSLNSCLSFALYHKVNDIDVTWGLESVQKSARNRVGKMTQNKSFGASISLLFSLFSSDSSDFLRLRKSSFSNLSLGDHWRVTNAWKV